MVAVTSPAQTFPAQTLLQIGQVAELSNVPIKTIRYYEEIGLLKSLGRTEGKFRLFPPDIIKRLTSIKRLQKLGLSLQEIAEILQVYDRGNIPCDDIKQKLELQLIEIDRRIRELETLRAEIADLLSDWTPAASRSDAICPNLQRRVVV
jgi:MerR family transcriptional regulator, copper efflux regulator